MSSDDLFAEAFGTESFVVNPDPQIFVPPSLTEPEVVVTSEVVVEPEIAVDPTSAVSMAARGNLIPLSAARDVISSTEPLASVDLSEGSTRFRLEDGWAQGLSGLQGSAVVPAFVTVDGTEYQLTKEAILSSTSAVGLNPAYTTRTPSGLIEPQLNYWFGEQGLNSPFKLLLVGTDRVGSAVTRASINPFSNVRLLNEALDAITAQYGDTQVLVDSKFTHDLNQTFLRLVIPDHVRLINGTGTDDDVWSVGVQLKNSLTGKKQTEINGYLFRWWCTNGAIDTRMASGVWSRKTGGQGAEVYEWARAAVDDVLGGLEQSLDSVQSLVGQDIAGEANDVLRDVFSHYKIPVQLREQVIANMVESEQLTMYALMNAITVLANQADLDPGHAESLMRAGGDIAVGGHARCNGCHRVI